MATHDIDKLVDGNGDEFNFRDSTKEAVANKVTSVRATSSATDTNYPSEKAVASAIEALDVASVGGSGKYISAISEADGKISATATTMDTTPTANSTKAVTSGGVKSALDDKNWFKNKGPSYLQNSNAYYQCISAATVDFSGLVKLYDVTEFFDGTIVYQNERSVFFGDVSLIRDGGSAGCKYARVCAMIGYSNNDSNIILQSDDDNAYPLLVKEDFDRLTPPSEIGAYVISNGTATLDTSVTRSRYFTVDCSSYSRMFINAGFYNPSGYGLGSIKAYIFVNDSNAVLGNADGTNFDGYVDVPSGATKLYLHTNNSYSQVSVGPTTNSPRYFLAMRYVTGWPAGTIEYFGRFYTRTTDSASYSARPLLLTYVQNLAPTGNTYIPSGYVVVKSAKYTTHSAVSDKLATARKLKTNLARTADSTFDGSADQTNIPVTGTLPIANGGTGATTAIGAEYNILNQVADDSPAGLDDDRKIALCNQTKSASNGVFRWTKLSYFWTYFKDKISSVLGLSESNGVKTFTGNAATATTATTAAGYTNDGAIATALSSKVDKKTDMGLSSNDFTDTYKSNVDSNTNARHTHSNKSVLDGISSTDVSNWNAAEPNVQSDWNQSTTTADDYIKNKPQNLVQDASYVHTDNNYTTAEKNKLADIDNSHIKGSFTGTQTDDIRVMANSSNETLVSAGDGTNAASIHFRPLGSTKTSNQAILRADGSISLKNGMGVFGSISRRGGTTGEKVIVFRFANSDDHFHSSIRVNYAYNDQPFEILLAVNHRSSTLNNCSAKVTSTNSISTHVPQVRYYVGDDYCYVFLLWNRSSNTNNYRLNYAYSGDNSGTFSVLTTESEAQGSTSANVTFVPQSTANVDGSGWSGIGSGTKPVYVNSSGVVTESSSTVGGGDTPVYMNNGQIIQCAADVGSAEKPVYMYGGKITASNASKGSSTTPIYMDNGTIKACGFKIVIGSIGTDANTLYFY